jgi:flagellar protein FliO/FliZ
MTEADSVSWVRFLFASVTVVSLMLLLGWALKYFSMRGWLVPKETAEKIKIIASMPVDARRKLVIARCEEIEYHLLLGPANDLVLSRKFSNPPETNASEP